MRVLEDREFYPLGSRKTRKVDVRIISATNRKLEQLVGKKEFREDLFYRLNVMRIDLPALVQRHGDLPLLIRHIMRKQAAAMEKQTPDISEAAMKILLDYPYPGNIRELENIIEHSLIICQDDVIKTEHLPSYIEHHIEHRAVKYQKDEQYLYEQEKRSNTREKESILKVLDKNGWHKGKTAAALSIDRTTLWRKMKKYNLQ